MTSIKTNWKASGTWDAAMKILYQIPPMSTFPNDGVSFWRFVRFEFARGHDWLRSGFEFKGVVAQRQRGASCSTAWHRKAADRLVEIEDSDWLKEIYADTGESWRDLWRHKHHYMIGLRDAATLEVIADSWALLPEEKGEWPRIELD
jgi:hypothetical protein